MTDEKKLERKAPSELTAEEFIADPYNRAAVALNQILRQAETDDLTRATILGDFQYLYDTLTEAELMTYHEIICAIIKEGGVPKEKEKPAVSRIWTPGSGGMKH